MDHRPGFSELEFSRKRKTTRREEFLGEMDEVVPWVELLEALTLCYPTGERAPTGLERMLHLYASSSGMDWPTKPSRTPSATAGPCAPFRASTSRPTRRRWSRGDRGKGGKPA